jgi:hypothetical protein
MLIIEFLAVIAIIVLSTRCGTLSMTAFNEETANKEALVP